MSGHWGRTIHLNFSLRRYSSLDFVEGTRCYFFNSTQTSVWIRWMMKTCQEHLQKLPLVPQWPPDWVRICKRCFKLEAKWKQGCSTSPSCTHLNAECLWSATEARYNFRIWNKTHLKILCSLPLFSFVICHIVFPSPFSPYWFPDSPSLAPFLSICLARTTKCPQRAGKQQKASMKESSGRKPFI